MTQVWKNRTRGHREQNFTQVTLLHQHSVWCGLGRKASPFSLLGFLPRFCCRHCSDTRVERPCPIWQLSVANQHCTYLGLHIKMIIFWIYWIKENILYLMKYPIRYIVRASFTVPFHSFKKWLHAKFKLRMWIWLILFFYDQQCFGAPICSLISLPTKRAGSD